MVVRNLLNSYLKSDTYHQGISPVLFAMRLMGVAPYNYANDESRFNPYYTLTTAIFWVLYVICVLKATGGHEFFGFHDASSVFIGMSDLCRIYGGFGVMVCLRILMDMNKNCISLAIKYMDDVGDMLKTIGRSVDYDQIKIKSLTGLALQIVCQFAFVALHMTLLDHIRTGQSFTMRIAMYTPGWLAELSLSFFITFIRSFYGFLARVNDVIDNIHKDKRSDGLTYELLNGCERLAARTKKDDPNAKLGAKIETVWTIYDKICDASDHIEKLFSNIVLVVFGMLFVSLVLNLYHGVMAAFWWSDGHDADHCLKIILFTLHQCTQCGISMLATVIYCQLSRSETQKTAKLINGIMIQESDEAVAQKFYLISVYMLHRSPKFTGGGLFDIDNSLLFTIVGAITIYMCILAQFTMSDG